MTPKLKVAVIGCGSIAIHRHAPEYAAHPQVDIVAFSDPSEERARQLAETYGGNAYTDHRRMLETEKPDAVSVCTPNALHAPVAIDAARAGAHVLCEKPMAVSLEQARQMIEAARDHGVFLMIGHNQRYMPPHIKAKELLQSGRLGRVLTFRTSFGHPGPESWSIEGKKGWFFRKTNAFVGAMGDLGVHKADLIRWLLEDEVAEIAAFVGTLHKEDTDVDDNATCILRMRSGAIGTLVASWTYYRGEDNSTVLWCENGVLKIGTHPEDQVIVELRDGTVETFRPGEMSTNERQLDSGVIHAFVRSVMTRVPPPIPGEEGAKSLAVILAAMESQERGAIIAL